MIIMIIIVYLSPYSTGLPRKKKLNIKNIYTHYTSTNKTCWFLFDDVLHRKVFGINVESQAFTCWLSKIVKKWQHVRKYY